MKLWLNKHQTSQYSEHAATMIAQSHVQDALSLLQHCPAHGVTDLHSAPPIAEQLGVGAVMVKDESNRMGQGSFKALGGAYAVFDLALAHLKSTTGSDIDPADIRSAAYQAQLGELTVACATAGNHGISVASAARLLGIACEVFISESVPEEFAQQLSQLGATVHREGVDYEASFAASKALCAAQGASLISDTSWQGYTDIPLTIMRGYLVLAHEAAQQCEQMHNGDGPTHIFLQAAVGGLAGSVAGYFADCYGMQTVKSIVVEPTGAACLMQSTQAERIQLIEGSHTVMGRLDCLLPSKVGYELLRDTAYAFSTIDDSESFAAMRLASDNGLQIGESGAAGLGALISACADPGQRETLGLDAQSRVLLVASEGPADLALFSEVTGQQPKAKK